MAPYPQLESPKTMHPLGWVAIAATAGLGVFVAATWVVPSGTDAAPFRLGVFIGATLPALIAAFLAGGIKKWRSPNRFAVVCFLVGIAWTSLVWVGSQVNHEKRLFLEASGRQPIKRAFWAKDRAFDDTFRAFFRKILDLNREYGEKANQIDSNEISKVGAVESFVNPDYAAKGIQQLHQAYLLDQEITQRLEAVVEDLRHVIDTMDMSAASKAEFRKGVEKGVSTSLQRRQSALNAERAYVEATDNLYEYANAHYAEFRIEDGRLRTDNTFLLSYFNSRMEIYNARRSAFIRATEEFTRAQSDILNKMGVSTKDAGLPY